MISITEDQLWLEEQALDISYGALDEDTILVILKIAYKKGSISSVKESTEELRKLNSLYQIEAN